MAHNGVNSDSHAGGAPRRPARAESCRGSVVVDERASQGLPGADGLVVVLDRGDPGVLEEDVRDPGVRAAVARVRVDAEVRGGPVRGLTDDVGGPGVADHGVLDLVAVDHRDNPAALDAEVLVVPGAARTG